MPEYAPSRRFHATGRGPYLVHGCGLAWQIRYLTHLYRGDPHRASGYRRELEWLTLLATIGEVMFAHADVDAWDPQ